MESTNNTEVKVGQTVPPFEMETYDAGTGQFGQISLTELKKQQKWTLLFFYPADFTFVCPTELADLAERAEALKKLGVEVVSVSTDTKFAHLAWHRTEKLLAGVRYIMAADKTGQVSKLMGVYDSGTGLALRGTFIIDPDGKLVASEINYYNLGRDAAELYRKVEAFVYLRQHPSEACPAKWKAGGKTLTPSEKLVGNVFDALK
jgi:NADH-dependent peroxiredoxin subunit C